MTRMHLRHQVSMHRSSVIAIVDLSLAGMHDKYASHSMTIMQDNRYLMHAGDSRIYRVDIDKLKAERLEPNIRNTANCFIEGEYMLVVRYAGPMMIFRDLREIGQIDFKGKDKRCKNDQLIRGRYSQQTGQTVFAVDRAGGLYRIEWQDIKDGEYRKTLVNSNVENLYVAEGLGLATLKVDSTLNLACETEVDLRKKFDSKAKWTIVTCIAKCYIISGDLDDQAIMATISKKGNIGSTLKLKLASNGFVNDDGREFAGIYSLHQAYVRGRRGIMMAIECDGCCHLISVVYGRMSKLQSIASIVNADVVDDKWNRIVMCVIHTDTEGVFLTGGFGWTRLISLKL